MPQEDKLRTTETQDSEAFAQWLDLQGLRFSHIPQETFVGGRGRFATLAKNKRMGVRKGLPDYIVVLPEQERLLFIEMKRKGAPPSAVKPEQRDWIYELNLVPGVTAFVARGLDEAMEAVKKEMRA